MRAAVGPDIDLMLEVHGRLNVPTAIAMARELARFDPRWIEEPTPPESIDALAEVRANSPIPIATGERYFEPERFLELIYKRAVDILQPDVGHVGGMLEAKKIAALAHMRYLPVAPHNPTGPVMNAMTLHVAATHPELLHPRDDRGRRAVAQGDRAGVAGVHATARSPSRTRPASAWNSTRQPARATRYIRHPIRQFDAGPRSKPAGWRGSVRDEPRPGKRSRHGEDAMPRWLFASLRGYRLDWLPADLRGRPDACGHRHSRAAGHRPARRHAAGDRPLRLRRGSLAFAAFGANRFMSVGADSTIAPIFAGGLARFAVGRHDGYAGLAALLALMVGAS